MRAAVMERGRIWVDDVPDPSPQPGEVVVKSVACGICGSDLHAARHTDEFVATSIEAGGAFKLTTFDPVVLGHEYCAEVMESNARFQAGQLVCAVPVLPRGPNVPVGYAPEAPGGFGQYMLLSERLLAACPGWPGCRTRGADGAHGRRPPRRQHGSSHWSPRRSSSSARARLASRSRRILSVPARRPWLWRSSRQSVGNWPKRWVRMSCSIHARTDPYATRRGESPRRRRDLRVRRRARHD